MLDRSEDPGRLARLFAAFATTRLVPDSFIKFTNLSGGFLSVTADSNQAILRHHDVDGKAVNEVTIGNSP